MDSRISSPMTVVQDTDPATTVTIQTQPTDTDQETNNDWLLAATNSIQVQIDASQLTTSHTEVLCTDSEAASAIMGVQSGDWISGLRGARYHNNGKYIIGYVDSSAELQQLLEDYQKITGTSFPAIQHLSLATKTSEEDYLQQRFLTPSARPRLFWQMHAGEPVIHFDGVPFITVGQCTDVPCILAGRRKTTTQLLVATGDVLPTKVHTHGCSAKISIRRILRYPTSKLPDTGIQGITAMRRLRKQVLEILTAKICAGLIKPTERYYFSLPTPIAHDTHIVPEVEDPPSVIEPIHGEIMHQISNSITSIGHIHDHLRKYIEKMYGENPSINLQDPTFNPSRYELARYIYWLYKSGRVIDQDCPFRERYSVLSESNTGEDKSIDENQPQDVLTTLYNISVGDTQLELTPPQVGAEEITSTASTIMMTHNIATPTPRTQKRASSQPGLLAIPKSNIFLNTESEYSNDLSAVQSAQQEVQSMLTILENQMYACNDLGALQILRRQLTLLCTEFSVHLAGQKRQHTSQSDNNEKRAHMDC